MKKLYIFDFDGTLAHSPTPEVGKHLYKEITGTEWPWQGWWGRIESMSTFDFDLIDEQATIAKEKNDTDIVFILTSRLLKFKSEIQRICKNGGLEISLDSIWTKTNAEKGERIFDLVNIFKNQIDEVFFYDDRQKEIDSAIEWKERIESFGVKLNLIKIKSDAID